MHSVGRGTTEHALHKTVGCRVMRVPRLMCSNRLARRRGETGARRGLVAEHLAHGTQRYLCACRQVPARSASLRPPARRRPLLHRRGPHVRARRRPRLRPSPAAPRLCLLEPHASQRGGACCAAQAPFFYSGARGCSPELQAARQPWRATTRAESRGAISLRAHPSVRQRPRSSAFQKALWHSQLRLAAMTRA